MYKSNWSFFICQLNIAQITNQLLWPVWFRQDLNTKAGTYLNNFRVHSKSCVIVYPGARIYIGDPKYGNFCTVLSIGEEHVYSQANPGFCVIGS